MQQALIAVRATLLLTILTGALYPALVTGLARLLVPRLAAGSMIERDGRNAGSDLIGQRFTRPEYFQGRPGSYDAAASGGSNFGPTSRQLIDRVRTDAQKFRNENPAFSDPLPADLLTTSASGLDPHISPASAEAQVARVAAARRAPVEVVRRLVTAHTEPRQLGIFGEPRVNVLLLNLALDRTLPGIAPARAGSASTVGAAALPSLPHRVDLGLAPDPTPRVAGAQ